MTTVFCCFFHPQDTNLCLTPSTKLWRTVLPHPFFPSLSPLFPDCMIPCTPKTINQPPPLTLVYTGPSVDQFSAYLLFSFLVLPTIHSFTHRSSLYPRLLGPLPGLDSLSFHPVSCPLSIEIMYYHRPNWISLEFILGVHVFRVSRGQNKW